MKTKLFTLLLAVTASIGTMQASDTQVDGIWYDFDSSTKTASVTYRGDSAYYYDNEYTGSVVIPSSVTYNSATYSVTSIGNYAFYNCSGLTSVTIPNSVTSIGEGAFYGCSGMTSITIPNSVTSIGGGAFLNCTGLTSVTIPNSVTSIGGYAFNKCTGLTSPIYNAHVFAYLPTSYSGAYTIPDGIESIAGGAFYNCNGLTSVTIPNSVTSIGSDAFYRCSSLTSIEIPNSVTSIGNYAFYNCSGLTSVTIPNSVTSIGESAFYGCSGLTSVTIPNSVTSIGKSAFYGCSGLTSVTIGNSVTSIEYGAFLGCSGLTSVTIPNSVTSIGTDAFERCTGLTSVTIGNSVTSIGNYAFEDCTGLTSIEIPNSVTSIGKYAFRGCTGLTSVIWDAKNYADYASYDTFYDLRSQITSFTFGNEVEHIPAYCCSGMNITSITIPNSVTSIGNRAFYECSGLTSVIWNAKNCADSASYDTFYDLRSQITSFTFGNEVEHIPAYCCSGMNITSITIPNSVTSIGNRAFYGCSGLTSVTIPNSVTSIGKSAFYGCSGLTSPVYNAYVFAFMPTSYSGAYTIPDGIESIAGGAFYDCTGLTSVTIPNSVTSIGEGAFYNCSGLTSVTIPNSVTSIGDYAFYNCTGLTSVTIPNSVTCIGSFAFDSCSSLTSVTIPNSVTSIGNYAFHGCTGLTSVTIPNSVTSIGDNAFYKCTSLTSVTIPNSVTSIGSSAFYGCSALTSMTIPNSVTSIGDYAFYGCSGLTSVTIPNSVTSIGYKAFSDCSSLTAIYVPCGEMERFKQMLNNDSRINDHAPLPYTITINAENGNVNIVSLGNYTTCDTEPYYKLTAVPNYGYHFTQWSDGNTDNPRTIELTQDTTFTAEFAKNSYAISTISANPEWGTTAGDTTALYMDQVVISASANHGYHFVRWDDGNTSNPRTVTVDTTETFTATFAKDIFSITKNAEHGSISGNSSAEYLDFVTLTVTPDYGYHFTQWSDGLKDNPRIFQITKDTAFTAEFAYDRVGTCGKDMALVWSYDPTNKVLTIGNAGSFTENMQFGLEAPNEMEELVIGNSVTAIGANAFAGIETLKKVSIGESVKTIGEQAFYNCVNLETIFNYRPTPTNTYSNAFDGVDKFECELYVLPSSIDMYKNAAVWRDFYYTYAIGAEETTVTTNDVQVEPQDNAATLTWPTNDNAASYTIQITKDGVVFCTLIFNANGQLIGIAFAPGRDREAHAPAALMTANGLQFTVTGLDSGTQYGYNVTAKDANDQTVATYSGEFTTTSEGIATGIDNIDFSSLQGGDRGRLILHNGQIFILRGEKVYTVTGQEVR